MLLIIWAKYCNFFQKCTDKPLTAWTYIGVARKHHEHRSVVEKQDVCPFLQAQTIN